LVDSRTANLRRLAFVREFHGIRTGTATAALDAFYLGFVRALDVYSHVILLETKKFFLSYVMRAISSSMRWMAGERSSMCHDSKDGQESGHRKQ
jgi:hypothetical protein